MSVPAVLLLWTGAVLSACGPSDAPPGGAGDPAPTNATESDDTARPGLSVDTGLALTIDDLVVEDNPHSVVSAFVSWSTHLPATSEVSVQGGAGPLTVRDGRLVTEHRVLAIGLHAEAVHTLVASSVTADGERAEASVAYTAATLPPTVPVAEVPTRDDARIQPGWTWVNLSNRDAGWPPVAVAYDLSGQPVWYAVHGTRQDTRGDVHVSLVPGPHVLIGPSGASVDAVELDLSGAVVWEGPSAPAPNFFHHQLERLEDGTNLALRKDNRGSITSDTLEIFDATHDVLWSWHLLDQMEPPLDASGDWSHCNAALPGFEPDQILLNCRNLSLILAVSRTDGTIQWRFGGDGDFAPDPYAEHPFPAQQHAPEVQPDGRLLLYDNQGRDGASRVVEVSLDTTTLTSSITWEFPGSFEVDPWYRSAWDTLIWGDADRLANGNILVTAGTRAAGTQSRVFEVTPDGQVVWELLLPAEPDAIVGVYRADRTEPPLEVAP